MARPRSGKSGAQRIAEILDEPDDDLNESMAAVGKAFFADEKNREAAPSRATYRSLRSVRAHFQGMSRRIAKIETGRKEAKKDVLEALKRYDGAMAAFAKALPDHATTAGAKAMAIAARSASRASRDLEQARAKLT